MATLRTLLLVTAREFRSYFASPLAAIFVLVFLAMSSGMTFFLGRFFERDQADMTTFFSWQPWLFLVLMPALGMRLWAEERRTGTIELLMTLPVRPWALVLGKFLAAWGFAGLALVLTMPMWATVNYLGDPDNPVILGTYLGSWLMAGAFLAIAACISVLTRNQVIAFIVAVMISFLLVMAGSELVLASLRGWAPQGLTEVVQSLSVVGHFNRIARGVIELPTLFFFASLVFLCLWLNVQFLNVKRAA
ncbi:MAG: ABC transporter permease [Burkholderiaceae bacterium]